jgi:hypothetical protein
VIVLFLMGIILLSLLMRETEIAIAALGALLSVTSPPNSTSPPTPPHKGGGKDISL